MTEQAKYLAITGGVGGAKLGLGLARIVPPERLAFLANTGDDFEHLGLHISPDLDTLMYTLAGLSNPETGWGRVEETWNFIQSFARLGGEDWFNLGDRDLAVHMMRTLRLADGAQLTEVTAELCRAMGVTHPIFPMSDDPVRTVVHTRDKALAFQHYFVRDKCKPRVTHITFDGCERAAITPATYQWVRDPALRGIVICPSNPFISVDPILAVPGLRGLLRETRAPVVAVSPIVAGEAIKGPTAKIMREFSKNSSAFEVARHYGDLLRGFVLDEQDRAAEAQLRDLGLAVVVAPTVMVTLEDRINLGQKVLDFIHQISI